MTPFCVLLLLCTGLVASAPLQDHSLTFVVDEKNPRKESSFGKFEKFVACAEYFVNAIRTGSGKTGNKPEINSQKLWSFPGLDGLQMRNVIVLRKENKDRSCEMIWSSFQDEFKRNVLQERTILRKKRDRSPIREAEIPSLRQKRGFAKGGMDLYKTGKSIPDMAQSIPEMVGL